MAKFEINSESDLINGKLDDAKMGDVILHKKLQFWELEPLLVKHRQGMKTEPAMIGTSIYTRYGTNVSLIVKMPE